MTPFESAILLNQVPDIGPVRFKSLNERFGDLSKVFSSSLSELKTVEHISEALARTILNYGKEQRQWVEKELERAQSHGVTILTTDSKEYPSMLKTMVDPPPVLYCRGNLKCLEERSIALVGSRRPTPYGERIAEILSRDLSQVKITTVSGLAKGIDTVVHTTTVQTGGKTVAVLGAGLMKLYPPENKKLADLIAEEGLILSEFPLLFPPEPGHFPRRNRIIAGLSLGTVVIEADEKSGALITAKMALEQGKDVFAVPGPVTSKLSRGPHSLIRQGAKLVECAQDILEEISVLKERFNFYAPAASHGSDNRKNLLPDLTQQEEKLLHFIHVEPTHVDFLLSQCRLSAGELSHTLLNLELKGTIRSVPGHMYVRN